MERLLNEIFEALSDPEVSKEDILNWISHERYVQEVCEDDGDEYSPGSFFYSKYYKGSRKISFGYFDEDIEIIEDDDDMDESDFISDELPTHTLGRMLEFREAYA